MRLFVILTGSWVIGSKSFLIVHQLIFYFPLRTARKLKYTSLSVCFPCDVHTLWDLQAVYRNLQDIMDTSLASWNFTLYCHKRYHNGWHVVCRGKSFRKIPNSDKKTTTKNVWFPEFRDPDFVVIILFFCQFIYNNLKL